jgi:hypothetical protein
MPIAILVLTLVAYGYVLLAYPELRRPALIAGALVAAALAFYFWRQAPEATRAGIRIAPEELTLDQLDLERTGLGATLTGRVLNGSPDYRLRDMTLTVRLRDCPEPEAEPATCPVIAEARAIARPDVPPGQLRGFSAHFTFANVPPLTGTLRWDLDVAATRATSY